MPTYEAQFKGRLKGADGICYPIYTQVRARDEKHAREALYDSYEHISNLRLEPKEPDKDTFVICYGSGCLLRETCNLYARTREAKACGGEYRVMLSQYSPSTGCENFVPIKLNPVYHNE